MIRENSDQLIIKQFRKEKPVYKTISAAVLVIIFWVVMEMTREYIPIKSFYMYMLVILLAGITGWAVDLNSFKSMVFDRSCGMVRLVRRSLAGSRNLGEVSLESLRGMALCSQLGGKEDGRLRMYLVDDRGALLEIPLLRRADRVDSDKVYASVSHWLHRSDLQCVAQKAGQFEAPALGRGLDLLMYWNIEPVATQP